ncbi:MAG: glutamine--tRNA ligase, partial [Sphaerochaetaceae bacterium]|nr:glutamine--tRNA ligase [Sphaerochaetaceae bacterium]
DPEGGVREVPFSKELYIEREDFMEEPIKGYHRFYVGNEVRLLHAYYVTCTDVIKDEKGEVVEIHCTYDSETRGGRSEDQRRVRGTSHWVSARHAIKGEVRLYDKLFLSEVPGEATGDYLDDLNPDSLIVIKEAYLEPSLSEAKAGEYLQFVRNGYFMADSVDHSPQKLVFNRTVTLRDSWSKQQKR